MSYTLPQISVFQEAALLPTALVEPLRACLVGGNAQLFRYANEKADCLLKNGAGSAHYNFSADTVYLYPNRPTGGIVDQDYVKLYADSALLQYYSDLIGAGGQVNPVSGYSNRIRSTTTTFKESTFRGVTYARSSLLYDRDVRVGDVVYIRGIYNNLTYTLSTYVKSFIGEPVSASIEAPTYGDTNELTNLAASSADVVFTAGAVNDVEATADASGYEGSVAGDIQETYTVRVTQGSIGGDFSTALLQVRSASGHDDADNVQPPAAPGDPFNVGTRGLTMTFDMVSDGDDSSSFSSSSVPHHDLVVDQVWTIMVHQHFHEPLVACSGTYTGTTDTNYIVTVTRGGLFSYASKPQITVSTTTGVDASGPTSVTGTATAIAIGTQGVSISFSGAGVDRLRAGDVYYIRAYAAGEGAMQTLVLSNNLPTQLQSPALDLELHLYIPKSGIEIPYESLTAGAYNYELGTAGVGDTSLTVKAGVQLLDSTWTDGGTPLPLDLMDAVLYLEYRAWLGGKTDKVYTISDETDIDAIGGQLHPDNPLKWAAEKAFVNCNGTPFRMIGVADPSDTDSWAYARNKLTGRNDVYGIVPLTRDATVLADFFAHVIAQSAADIGHFRTLWVSLYSDPVLLIANNTNSTDDQELDATISEDGDAAGQYTIVEVPAGNAQFETLGVRAGDIMRYHYNQDYWGNVTYVEYIIDAVLNQDTLRLRTGQHAAAAVVPAKMEVWRTQTNDDIATALVTTAQGYNSSRVRAVWPDVAGDGVYTFDGYFLCAALAGLRTGIAPHQSMTNLEITGITDVSRTDDKFNRTQLDEMAGAGVWVVTKADDGAIVTRHGMTTAGYGDLLTQEEMIVSNSDSISAGFRTTLDELRGITNITASSTELIRLSLEGKIAYYKQVFIPRLGGQIVDGGITEVSQDPIFADRLVISSNLTLPAPLNNVDLHQQLVI